MRTVTTLWAAALAVVSLTGPFTTAEAAPARLSDPDRQVRPIFRKRSFNETDARLELRDPNPQLGLSLPPILGGTPSSLPPPGRTDPAHKKHGKAPKHDHVSALGGLLSNGLLPASSSAGGLLAGLSTALQHTPPLLGTSGLPLNTPLSALSTALPGVVSDVSPLASKLPGTGGVGSAVGSLVSTVAHAAPTGAVSSLVSDVTHKVPTGAVSSLVSDVTHKVPTGAVSSLVSDVTHKVPTGAVSSLVSDVTHKVPTGAVSSLVSDVTHAAPTGAVSSLVSDVTHGVGHITTDLPVGVPSLGTGITGTGGLLPGVTGKAGSILASVQSEATSVISSLMSATTLVPAQITEPVASLESSLQSQLSQISLTATDPALVSALSSGFSSILSNVGSTLSGITASVAPLVPTISGPVGSILSTPTSVVGSILSDPTAPIGSIISNPTSPLGSILSNPTGIVGSFLPPPGSVIPPVTTSPLGTGGLGPIVSVIPTPTGGPGPIVSAIPTPTGGITITGPGTTVVVSIPTNTPGTSVDSTAPGIGTTTGTDTGTGTATDTSTDSTPQGTGVSTPPSSGSPITVTASETATSVSVTAVPTATPNTVQSPSTTSTTTHSDATQNAPDASIKPTGTDTRTVVSLPTVWTFAPSSGAKTAHTVSGIQTAGSATQSSSAGLATFLPKLVQPATGMPDPGSNYTLIQVGFKFGLNYPFVVGQPESTMQIMAYLPKGISHGLGIEKERVMMNALMPYDTSAKLGYVTTLAQAYIPKELVDQLQLSIHTSSSPIYYYDDVPVQQLMRMINPTIPILPGSSFDGLGPYGGFDGKAAAGAGSGSGAGAPIGSDAGTTKRVKSTSVGIAGAAVAGAAVYAASMMYIARRYRQRRKRHQRASSVPTAGEMRQRSSGGMGSLFMAGANGRGSTRGSMTIPGGRGSRTSNGSSNGRSIREQGISAPLMSENSLGWN